MVNVPPSEWIALIHDHHPGYITWEQHQRNLARLAGNAAAYGHDRRRGPPREGPALLQGIAVCGVCGDRMTVRYSTRRSRPATVYVCQRKGIDRSVSICQSVPGTSLERAIAELLETEMTPRNANLALKVQAEIQARIDEADALRALAVRRRQDEADTARRRYLKADPDNRLVADVLEAEWNRALQNLEAVREEYERRREQDRENFSERQKRRIHDLCRQFPRVFDDPDTPSVDRKRMVRLLIEDVAIVKAEKITLGVRMRGGLLRRIELPLPLSAPELRRTPPEIVAVVDELLERCTDAEIADELNRRGHVPPAGGRYTRLRVNHIRKTYRLEPLYRRLRRKGLLTGDEMAARLGVCPSTVGNWRLRGMLKGHRSDGRGNYLYEWPADPPRPFQRRPKECGAADEQCFSEPAREVQYAT